MKFHGNGTVWNPKNDSPLVRFEGGVHETQDKHVIDQLVKAGYKHDGFDVLPVDVGVSTKPIVEHPKGKAAEALPVVKVKAPSKAEKTLNAADLPKKE